MTQDEVPSYDAWNITSVEDIIATTATTDSHIRTGDHIGNNTKCRLVFLSSVSSFCGAKDPGFSSSSISQHANVIQESFTRTEFQITCSKQLEFARYSVSTLSKLAKA